MSDGIFMSEVVDIVLLTLLAVTGIAVIRTRNLFAAAMLAGIYSLVSAGLFTVMDAVDVAFTEAAVGAGISTVLVLGTLALVGHQEVEPRHKPILPMFVVLVTGGILVYGTSQIPPFGDPSDPAHHHVAPYYVEESLEDTEIPNIVTSVLASYRGYDTMGETTVVFTALVGVLLLLSRGALPRRVYHEGRWLTARPGETREELQAELEAGGPVGVEAPGDEADVGSEADAEPPKGGERG